jgi:Zn-dependent peptidase ImmA (M78 family)
MKWTTEKVSELRTRYPHEDNATLARELGCSRKALAFRASSLGIKKTEGYNETRYARLGKKPPEHLIRGERRRIETGTVIVRGNTLTHLSNYSIPDGA